MSGPGSKEADGADLSKDFLKHLANHGGFQPSQWEKVNLANGGTE